MKHTLSFFITLLASSFSLAQTEIISPYVFSVSSKEYAKILNKDQGRLAGTFTEDIGHFDVRSTFLTTIEGAKLNLNYDMQFLMDETKEGRYPFVGRIGGMNISINKIATHDSVVREVGGGYVRIRVDGECYNVSLLNNQESFEVQGVLQLTDDNGRLKIVLEQMDLLQLSKDWTVSSERCVGEDGYQRAVENEMMLAIRDMALVNKTVKEAVEVKLASVIETVNAELLKVSSLPFSDKISGTMTPMYLKYSPTKDQVLVIGDVSVKFDNGQNSTRREGQFSEQDLDKINSTGLTLPQSFFTPIVTQLYLDKAFQYDFMASDVSALDSLFSNGFFQFFLWPDLLSFKSKTPFKFHGHLTREPKTQFSADDGSRVWMDVTTAVQVDMHAPKKQEYVPYMYFWSNMSFKSWVGVESEKLEIGMVRPTMNLNAGWDKEYVKNYKPWQSINKGFFNGKIRDALHGKNHLFDLPKLDMGALGLLVPVSVGGNDSNIQLKYQQAPENE